MILVVVFVPGLESDLILQLFGCMWKSLYCVHMLDILPLAICRIYIL